MNITLITKARHIINTFIATILGLMLFLIGGEVAQEISISGIHEYPNKVDVERKGRQKYLNKGMLPIRLDLARPFLDHVLSVDSSENKEEIHRKVAYYAKVLLHISPANARAWCALSFVEFQQRPSELRALDYFIGCYQYGAREGTLQPWRLEIAFAVWEYLPDNIRNVVFTEVIECLENITGQPAVLGMLGKFALIAPERDRLARIVVELQGGNVVVAFEKYSDHYRYDLISGKRPKR